MAPPKIGMVAQAPKLASDTSVISVALDSVKSIAEEVFSDSSAVSIYDRPAGHVRSSQLLASVDQEKKEKKEKKDAKVRKPKKESASSAPAMADADEGAEIADPSAEEPAAAAAPEEETAEAEVVAEEDWPEAEADAWPAEDGEAATPAETISQCLREAIHEAAAQAVAGQAANGGSAQEVTVNLKGHVGVSLHHGNDEWEEEADAQDEYYAGGDTGINALDEAQSSSPAESLHTFSGGSHGASANDEEEEEFEEEDDE